jgi:hypothetical protein
MSEISSLERSTSTVFHLHTGDSRFPANGLVAAANLYVYVRKGPAVEIQLCARLSFKGLTTELKKHMKVGLRLVNEGERKPYQWPPLPLPSGDYIFRSSIPGWKELNDNNYLEQDILRLRFDILWSTEGPADVARMAKLREDMLHILDSGAGSDFNLECEGLMYPVHSGILTARSKVFARMMEEKNGKRPEFVKITDMQVRVLMIMLEYVYSSEIDLQELDFSDVASLARAGHKYGLEELKDICFDHLEKTITNYTCGEVAVLSFLLSAMESTHRRIYEYCVKNWMELGRLPEFQVWVKQHPEAFLEITNNIASNAN